MQKDQIPEITTDASCQTASSESKNDENDKSLPKQEPVKWFELIRNSTDEVIIEKFCSEINSIFNPTTLLSAL